MNTETSTTRRLLKARTTLLLDHPFFGALLFRLKGRESRRIKTMATDGVFLFHNPDFVESLNSATLVGVLAHEVLHPALHHHVRRAGRDPRRWNEACDYAINPLLLDDGFSLPEAVLVDERFRGMSAEQIYNLRESEAAQEPQESPDSGEDAADGQGPTFGPDGESAPETEGGIGQVMDAPSEGEGTLEEQAREWTIAVNQAMTVASRAGKLPLGMKRALKAAGEARVDWREMLRRLWSETTPADYSWMRPNRRHIWSGVYLPGVVREGVGEVAIAVDCSGSVNERQLGLFGAEIRSILEGQRPQRVHVLYFDAKVQRADTYECGEPIALEPVGGGGTEFGPCFEWLAEKGIQPQTLVFLTDLYGSFPMAAPSYPVLWASTGGGHAPFGEVIPMQAA
jgi:predicted metal-dependent peptidase